MLEELECILSFPNVYKFTSHIQKIFWETMQAVHTQYNESLTQAFLTSSARKRILPKQNCVYF